MKTGDYPRDFGQLLLEPGQYYNFDPETFPIKELGGQAHYAPAIIYALTGNKTLGAMDYVQSQFDPDFADAETKWDIGSACLTHQVMAVHEIRSTGYCEDAGDHDELMATLQKKMRQLLIDDPRAGDVYIQRVMMLVMTGAIDQVKPVWFRRIVDAQRSNGGWLPYQLITRLTPGFLPGRRTVFPKTEIQSHDISHQLPGTAAHGDDAAGGQTSLVTSVICYEQDT